MVPLEKKNIAGHAASNEASDVRKTAAALFPVWLPASSIYYDWSDVQFSNVKRRNSGGS